MKIIRLKEEAVKSLSFWCFKMMCLLMMDKGRF